MSGDSFPRRVVGLLRRTPFHPQWLIRCPIRRPIFNAVAGGYVLDIGCADRWAASQMPRDARYVGLDYPKLDGVEYASRPDVFGDAQQLPFRDGAFDTVLFLEVLEHLPAPARALAEVHRILRPGGMLVFSMPFIYPVHDAPHDYQRFTEYGLRRSLANAGFGDVQLNASSNAIEAAGLTASLALAGSAMVAIERPGVKLVVLPVVAALVPIVNMATWALARLLPDWSGVTAGYEGTAVRQ